MRILVKTPTKSFEYEAPDGRSNFTVGKRTGNDVILEGSETAANLHVRIESFIGRWSFSDQFTDHGTQYNGNREFSHELKAGDVLTLGDCTVQVLSIDGNTTPPAPQEAWKPNFDAGSQMPPSPIEVSTQTPSDDLVWGRDPVHEDLCEDDLDDPLFQGYLASLLIGRQPSAAEMLELQLEAHRLAHETRNDASDEVIENEVLPLLNKERALSQGQPPAQAPTPETRQPSAAHVQRIAAWALFEFFKQTGHDFSKDSQAQARLHEAATRAVIELDSAKSTEINLPFIAANQSGPLHLQVTLERKHLHQEPGKPVERELRRPEQVATIGRARNRRPVTADENRKRVVSIVISCAVVIVFVIASIMAPAFFDPDDEVTPPTEHAQANYEKQRISALDERKQLEEQLKAAIKLIAQNKNVPAHERIDQLIALEAAAEMAGIDIKYDASRTRRTLDSALLSEVSREYQKAGSELYELRATGDFTGAMQRLEALAAWVAVSEHHAAPAERYEVPKWISERQADVLHESERHVATVLFNADQALARSDFALAADVMIGLERGVLSDTDRELFEAERAEYLLQAAAQQDGTIPAPIPEFERAKHRLPTAGTGKLANGGESSVRTRFGRMLSEVEDALRQDEYEPRVFTALGREITLHGHTSNSLGRLVVKRPHGAGHFEYAVTSRLGNLPSSIRLALVEMDERPALPDQMGLLVYCFDNGLWDDAGRIAFQIRHAFPDLAEDLNTYLAGKWKAEVPEGGFPERDGRVVRE